MKKRTTTRLIFGNLAICLALSFTTNAQGTQGSGALPNTAFPAAGGAGTDRTFVGSGAGAANTGANNTFLGMSAGLNNASEHDNTFVGWHSGLIVGSGGSEVKAFFNTFVGSQSGVSTVFGADNTFLGHTSGFSNDGDDNVFLGSRSGYTSTSGTGNSCVGWSAGYGIGTLTYSEGFNTIMGFAAGYGGAGSQYSFNNLFGCRAGYGMTTGSHNVFMGDYSGYKNSTGDNNIFIGSNSGYENLVGAYNVFIGTEAGRYNTANYNTLIGYETGTNNTTGTYNVFMGYQAGVSNNVGDHNIFLGLQAGYSNTKSSDNVAIGLYALYSQNYGTAAGTYNVAIGNNALFHNNPTSTTNGYHNAALGTQAGYNNSTGSFNVFLGNNSGRANTTGSYNSFSGYQAGYGNINATNNTFSGYAAGYYTTSGGYNTSIGSWTGISNTTGDHNTFLGYASDVTGSAYSNCTSIGFNSTCTATQTITLGNSSITTLRCQQTSITGISDRRAKNNIQENVPGLAFINLLKPVTFHYDVDNENQIIGAGDTAVAANLSQNFPGKYDIEQTQYTGFIAQAVDSAAQSVGYDFSGVYKPQDESKDLWGLRYSDFIPPMVLAIQQLSKEVDSLKAVNSAQAAQRIVNNQGDSATSVLPTQQVTLASKKAILYQNNPNPASDQTSIGYYLADGTTNAEIVFFDMYGKEIKRVVLENRGNAALDVNTKDLDSGIYSYSLIVDGKVVDTLKMVRTK